MGIYLPHSVTVRVSVDGTSWSAFGPVLGRPSESAGTGVARYRATVPPGLPARYVQVTVAPMSGSRLIEWRGSRRLTEAVARRTPEAVSRAAEGAPVNDSSTRERLSE